MKATQKITAGYKQTEVGVIPEDWDVKPFHDIVAKFIDYRGVTPKKLGMDWGNGDIRALSANNVQMGYIDFNRECYLGSESLYKRWMRNGDCHKGDILLTMEAPLGNVAFIPNNNKYILSQRTLLIKPLELIDKDLLRCLMMGKYFQRCLLDNASGSTAQGIQRKRLEKISIFFPKDKSEQTVISNILFDTDALIEKMEKMIVKKKAIKQGAMQQLLTGKKRLQGFSGEWSVKLLPKISWFQEGPGVRTSQFTQTGIKLLNGTNIYNGKLLLDNTNRFISEAEAFGPYSHFLADEGDIVIASSGITIDKFEEKISFVRKEHLPLCMNTSTIRFKTNRDCLESSYLYYFLMSKMFKDQIGAKATGSAQLNFGPSHLEKVEVYFPENCKEQSAITLVLSDLETEIEKLESQLYKYKSIKEGMMQQLLTGKIRIYANR